MKTFPLFVRLPLVVLALSACGCATVPSASPSVMRLPPSTAVRTGMGSVTVVMRSDERGPIDLYRPMGSEPGMSAANRAMIQTGKDCGGVGNMPEAAMIMLPIVTANFLYNLTREVADAPRFTEAGMREAMADLSPALAEVKLAEPLRDRVVALAHGQAPDGITISTASAGQPNPAPANTSASTVLEITLGRPSLDGGTSPELALGVTVQLRLVDARTGRELYYDHLGYRGSARRLSAWAVKHGQPLRDEAERCVHALASEIVAQLFTRSAGTPSDQMELATLGLRRLPEPGRAAMSPPDFPRLGLSR